jgi:hypothetical protein
MVGFKLWLENIDLHLATADDQGVHFETGVPVTFHFVHAKKKSGYHGDRFQQDIEPAGRYMVHNENPGDLSRNFESGEITFYRPLVLKFNPVDHSSYDENNWKFRLHKYYRKKGKALSMAIRQDGYDGIVTVGRGPYASEIVDLTGIF